jgi:ribosome-associated protein
VSVPEDTQPVGEAAHAGPLSSSTTSEPLALRLAALADSKLAEEIVVLDMRELVSYTDFLVICTARNERQLNAVVDEVRVRLKQDEGLIPGQTEGGGGAGWAVLDYLDCVLHVFTPDARKRYDLEELWRDAGRVEVPESAPESPRSATV